MDNNRWMVFIVLYNNRIDQRKSQVELENAPKDVHFDVLKTTNRVQLMHFKHMNLGQSSRAAENSSPISLKTHANLPQ